MIDKRMPSLAQAVAGIKDGATVMIGGFGAVGQPDALVDALVEQGARDLVVVSNNAGGAEDRGLSALIGRGRVRRLICSFPVGSPAFEDVYRQGRIELELVPQGTLAERIRAAGAGIPAFYTPTAAGTRIAEGKEARVFDNRPHVMERALAADVALIRARHADRWGNLTYRGSGRNFNPVMATAATMTIVQVERFVELGAIAPDAVVTPGIFVHRVVEVGS
jgi:3-oxoadipate CoA-transferase, alpha subunit